MPTCLLRAAGPGLAVDLFCDTATDGGELTFGRLVPVEEETSGVYHAYACQSAWGSGEDIAPTRPHRDETSGGGRTVEWRFDATLAPPLDWLARAALEFPELRLTLAWYDQMGNRYGHTAWFAGEPHTHRDRFIEFWYWCPIDRCDDGSLWAPDFDDIVNGCPPESLYCARHQLEGMVAAHVRAR